MNMMFPVNITSNDRSFECPVVYTDTIHYAMLFIDIKTKLGTKKLIRQLVRHIWR